MKWKLLQYLGYVVVISGCYSILELHRDNGKKMETTRIGYICIYVRVVLVGYIVGYTVGLLPF